MFTYVSCANIEAVCPYPYTGPGIPDGLKICSRVVGRNQYNETIGQAGKCLCIGSTYTVSYGGVCWAADGWYTAQPLRSLGDGSCDDVYYMLGGGYVRTYDNGTGWWLCDDES